MSSAHFATGKVVRRSPLCSLSRLIPHLLPCQASLPDIAALFTRASDAPTIVVAVHAVRSGAVLLERGIVPPTLPAVLLLSGTDVSQTMAPLARAGAPSLTSCSTVAQQGRGDVDVVVAVVRRVTAVVAFNGEMLSTFAAFCNATGTPLPTLRRVIPQAIDVTGVAVRGTGVPTLADVAGSGIGDAVYLLPCGLRAVKAPAMVVEVRPRVHGCLCAGLRSGCRNVMMRRDTAT